MSSTLSALAAARWPLVAVSAALILAVSAQAAEKKKRSSKSDGPAATAPQAAEKNCPTASRRRRRVRASEEAFLRAFNRGDAKAVAALWTPNGSLADERGEIFKGRKAIEDQYAAFFKEYPGAKIEVAVKSIEFPGAAWPSKTAWPKSPPRTACRRRPAATPPSTCGRTASGSWPASGNRASSFPRTSAACRNSTG